MKIIAINNDTGQAMQLKIIAETVTDQGILNQIKYNDDNSIGGYSIDSYVNGDNGIKSIIIGTINPAIQGWGT